MSTSLSSLSTNFFPSPQNGFQTTLASTIASGATTVPLNSVAGYTNGQIAVFVIDPTNTSLKQTFTGVIDTAGVQVTSVVWTAGTNATHTGGATVVDYATATHIAMVTKGLLIEHKQSGAHAAITADSVTVATGKITTTTSGKLEDAAIPLTTYRSEASFDFVASGCVWTADSAGSTKVASMTAGVVYIGGKRVVVSAVTSRTFTASKDVYVDVDNTGALTYTDGTTNAASGALAANSIRLAIVVVGASNIATAASINQGQEDRVLPIASSIAYSVTDSLGNLICPRDPNRKVLGLRQIVSNFAPGTTVETLITGLNCPVIIPTGRKVKATLFTTSASTSGIVQLGIYSGVFGSGGTEIQAANVTPTGDMGHLFRVHTPASTSLTYTASVLSTSGNPTLTASATGPIQLLIELA